MANRLEELLKKLEKMEEQEQQEKTASSKEEEQSLVKLSEEDLEVLQALGTAYVSGLIEGLTKLAEEEAEGEADLVDLDGDGVPDHIAADPEEVVAELEDMVEKGEISLEEATQIAEAVAEAVADEPIEEKTAGLRDFLSSIGGKISGGFSRIKPYIKQKKVLIPLGVAGVGGPAAYYLYRRRKKGQIENAV